MGKSVSSLRRASGQATLELAAVVPLILALLAATLGLAISFSRHAILHYGVHMATRAAATARDPAARGAAVLRRTIGLTSDASALFASPKLVISVTSDRDRASVAATYLDATNPLRFPSSVRWQLPVEKDVIK